LATLFIRGGGACGRVTQWHHRPYRPLH